jgi:hypothetical protein
MIPSDTKWMRQVNAWRVAGVANPGYGCFGDCLQVARFEAGFSESHFQR